VWARGRYPRHASSTFVNRLKPLGNFPWRGCQGNREGSGGEGKAALTSKSWGALEERIAGFANSRKLVLQGGTKFQKKNGSRGNEKKKKKGTIRAGRRRYGVDVGKTVRKRGFRVRGL